MWLDDLRPLQFGAATESERLNEAAYQAFGIAQPGAGMVDGVGARLPFGQMRMFSRSPQPRRRVLVVAPMAGAYPFLMRDLVMRSEERRVGKECRL